MSEQALFYALSTLAQTCAALAAFVGAVGLFRLQILRDQQREAEFEFRARVWEASGHATQGMSIAAVIALAERINPDEARRRIAEGRSVWEAVAPQTRRTIYTLAVFEAWILFVIVISLGGLAHVPALACFRWSSVALWGVTIITAAVTGGSLFVWLDVRRLLRRLRDQTP